MEDHWVAAFGLAHATHHQGEALGMLALGIGALGHEKIGFVQQGVDDGMDGACLRKGLTSTCHLGVMIWRHGQGLPNVARCFQACERLGQGGVVQTEGARACKDRQSVRRIGASQGFDGRDQRLNHGLLEQVALAVDHHRNAPCAQPVDEVGRTGARVHENENLCGIHGPVTVNFGPVAETDGGARHQGRDARRDELVLKMDRLRARVVERRQRDVEVVADRAVLTPDRNQPFHAWRALDDRHRIQALRVGVPFPVHAST